MSEFVIPTKAKTSIIIAPTRTQSKTKVAADPMISFGQARFDFGSLGIQPKLKLSQPGDPYEQEADRIAEQVMGMSSNPANLTVTNKEEGVVDRKCTECKIKKEDKNLKISRKITDLGINNNDNAEIDPRPTGGSPLDANSREIMESRFGFDFRKVRLHTDGQAARSAKSISALAYTVGNNIVFGQGQYNVHSPSGLKLLAHELVHVVQQNRGHGMAVQRTPAEPTDDERREFVRNTIWFLNESADFLGNERVTIDQALFERLINNWYLMVEDRERIIDSQLGGDVLLRRDLRAAYIAAIRVLMSRAASALGRNERDLYRENTGRIPMWAWLTPHHTESGISTPIAEGRTADVLTGDVNFTANGIQVTIAPDTTDPGITGAETAIRFAPGNINFISHPQGGQQVITSFTGPGTPTARIQTTYGAGASSRVSSGYGRGTTQEDIAGGRVNPRSTTLGFHEGHHGMDYVQFIENNPPPQFTGTIGMTTTQFNAAITQWQNDWTDYNNRINEFSKRQTDCVGTMTIDQHNQAHAAPGAVITLHCTP